MFHKAATILILASAVFACHLSIASSCYLLFSSITASKADPTPPPPKPRYKAPPRPSKQQKLSAGFEYKLEKEGEDFVLVIINRNVTPNTTEKVTLPKKHPELTQLKPDEPTIQMIKATELEKKSPGFELYLEKQGTSLVLVINRNVAPFSTTTIILPRGKRAANILGYLNGHIFIKDGENIYIKDYVNLHTTVSKDLRYDLKPEIQIDLTKNPNAFGVQNQDVKKVIAERTSIEFQFTARRDGTSEFYDIFKLFILKRVVSYSKESTDTFIIEERLIPLRTNRRSENETDTLTTQDLIDLKTMVDYNWLSYTPSSGVNDLFNPSSVGQSIVTHFLRFEEETQP